MEKEKWDVILAREGLRPLPMDRDKPKPNYRYGAKKLRKLKKAKKLGKTKRLPLWKQAKAGVYIDKKVFFNSPEWKQLRVRIYKVYGRICGKCGSTKHIQVDHIKPRIKFPELQLDFSNLQILCKTCNMKKMIDHGPEHDHRLDQAEMDLVEEASKRF